MSDEEVRAAMGARLLTLRAGVSQAVFADRLGVHPKTIQRWEAGAALPDGESLLALWREYGAEPSWVLKGGEGAPAYTPEERTLLTYFRAASEEIRRAAMGALLGAGPRHTQQEFKGPVGNVIRAPVVASNLSVHMAGGNYAVKPKRKKAPKP